MALTVVQLGRNQVTGSRMSTTLKITPDSSWEAAGESLDLTQYVPVIETVLIDAGTGEYNFAYDRTLKVLQAYWADYDATADGGLVPAAGEDLSGLSIHITVTGTRA